MVIFVGDIIKKKLLCVITARASYSRIRTVLLNLKNNSDLDVTICLSASASDPLYGDLLEILKDDGFTLINVFENNLSQTSSTTSIKVVALSLLDIEVFLRVNEFDGVISIADRYETIATAICASFTNTKLFHIQGGEISGNIDDKVRNAISMMADVHFPATDLSEQNLIRYGIDSHDIYQYGCPSVDQFVSQSNGSSKLSFEKLITEKSVGHAKFQYGNFHIIMMHPETDKADVNEEYAAMLLNLVSESNHESFLWFWPNSDPASSYISKTLRAYRESNECKNVNFVKNLPPSQFVYLLNGARSLIGNSSLGVRETAVTGLPVLNIGCRQKDRESHDNVIHCEWDSRAISSSFEKIKSLNRNVPDYKYGKGNAGELIAKKIGEIL